VNPGTGRNVVRWRAGLSNAEAVGRTLNAPSDDAELRRGIRLLGSLLERVLKTQAEPGVAITVERLERSYASLRRTGSQPRRRQLIEAIEQLTPDAIGQVARAFNLYFSLLDIAEESFHLHQRRRQAERGEHHWPGSFHETLSLLKQSGVTPEKLQTLLDTLLYLPVLTAHPTEAKRRTVKGVLRDIFLTHEKLDDPRTRGRLRQEVLGRLQNQIQQLWKTDEIRARSMGVADEIDTGLFYFPLSLFQATARVYRNFEHALSDVYGVQARSIRLPGFLRFGSWIGGDRDGNPNVTPQTLALALRLQALTVLQEYVRRLDELQGQLSHSYGLCQPTAAFAASLEADRAALGAAVAAFDGRYLQEPYRHKLALMKHRMERAAERVEQSLRGDFGQPDDSAYSSAAAFMADLQVIRDSLRAHGDGDLAAAELQDLIRLVDTFGFHLMQLDVRQESGRHTEAVAEILRDSLSLDYHALDERQRLEILSEAILVLNPVEGAAPGGLSYDSAGQSCRAGVSCPTPLGQTQIRSRRIGPKPRGRPSRCSRSWPACSGKSVRIVSAAMSSP
jgi:phosphoenolpyruvate carboxylase